MHCNSGLGCAALLALLSVLHGHPVGAAQPGGGAGRLADEQLALARARDLEGVWEPLIHEDVEDRIPGPMQGDYAGIPANDAARAVAQAWDPSSQLAQDNQCTPHTAVYLLRAPFRIEILLSDRLLALASESFEQLRMVYLDGRPHHPEESPHTRMGHSTGRWQGTSLVVETTHLLPGYLKRNGLPHSDRARLTEYFTRQSGARYGELLTVLQIVEDPVYLSEPLVRSVTFRRVGGGKLEPYPCIVLDL